MPIERSLQYKNKPRLSSYCDEARARGLSFNLSQAAFDALSAQPCHYCGVDGPSGVDRRDNVLGYEEGNCLSACIQCNYSKGSHSYEVFMGWLRRIAVFLK